MSDNTDKLTLDDDFYANDESSSGGSAKPWIIGGGIVAVLAGLYVGGAFVVADRIPKGTVVSGVNVGGMTEEDAAAKIESELSDDVLSPVSVTVAGTELTGEIDPAKANVTVDGAASVEGLTGLSFNPARLWSHISGSEERDAVVTFDEDGLRETIDELNSQLASPPVNASISFVGSTVEVTPAEPGTGIDIDEAAEVLSTGWLTEARPIELAASQIDPEITDEDIAAVREQYADPLVVAPVKVTVGEKEVVLSEADLAGAATFTEEGGEVTMNFDPSELVARVEEEASSELTEAEDAQIVMDGHTAPKIIESKNGQTLDTEATAAAIQEAAFGDNRSIDATVIEDEPELTTAEAEELGVNEVVAEISTPLTDDPVRTENLVVGTSRTNNTLVLPGEEFSLLEQLGEITEENGYVSSGVVMDGFNSNAIGGGLSQLSTNTFNLGYWGGMEDIEHQPHSKYFSRYPKGVESTLWVPSLDMRWKNNSPYAVLVETWVADGQVHSRLWSTKYYDVDISVSEPYNVRQPGTETNTAADCVPSGAGGPGFTVDVHRTVKHDGDMVYDNSYSWTYQPVHAVRCG